MKLLYRLLVALHPPAFRRQFGQEMNWIFAESNNGARVVFPLFRDVLISLARQWLFRTPIWIVPVAAAGGAIPFVVGFQVIRLGSRFPGSAGVNPQQFIVITVLISLAAIVATLLLAILWFRFSRRRLRA